MQISSHNDSRSFINKLLRINPDLSCLQWLKPDKFSVQLANYGDLNKERIIYIIRQCKGRGLFSLVSSVICHVHLANKFGLVPVVDFKNYQTEHNDSGYDASDNLTHGNAWEYYFKPVSDVSLDEAYRSQKVLLSGFSVPEGYPHQISQEISLRETGINCIRLRDDLAKEIDGLHARYFASHKVLGVHFRGQEMKIMPNHYLPPSKRQIKYAIDSAIRDSGFERIFVITEDAGYLEFLKEAYGSAVISMPHYRTKEPVNAYRQYSRPMHKYLLGKELLIDTMLLARCQGIVSSYSNISDMARLFNPGTYEADIVIDNGPNSSSRKIAKHLWKVRDFLPEGLGGFSVKAVRKNI